MENYLSAETATRYIKHCGPQGTQQTNEAGGKLENSSVATNDLLEAFQEDVEIRNF
jgi:hypothetical protein